MDDDIFESALSHANRSRPVKGPQAFRTIGEASLELGLEPHVLRFWETKFTALRPVKQKGGRRLYRPADMALLRTLQRLLREDGYTIRGAQKLLAECGRDGLLAGVGSEPQPAGAAVGARELQAAVAAAAEAGAFGREAAPRSGRLASEEKLRLGRALEALNSLRARLEAHRTAPADLGGERP